MVELNLSEKELLEAAKKAAENSILILITKSVVRKN